MVSTRLIAPSSAPVRTLIPFWAIATREKPAAICITVLCSFSPALDALANFWLIPFSALVALLDKLEKPRPSELAILVDKLVTLDMILPEKELLIALAALLAFELIVLNAELTLLVADVAKLETELVAFEKAF